MARDLTEKARRFAEAYAGDGVRAAQLAGYEGTRSSLASIASRLLKDERVKAIVEARRSAAPPAEAPAPAQDVDLDDPLVPLAVIRGIAGDETAHPSARLRAAEVLQRREDKASEGQSLEEYQAALRAKVGEILAARTRALAAARARRPGEPT